MALQKDLLTVMFSIPAWTVFGYYNIVLNHGQQVSNVSLAIISLTVYD